MEEAVPIDPTKIGVAIANNPEASRQTGETARAGVSAWVDTTKIMFLSFPLMAFGMFLILIALVLLMFGDDSGAFKYLIMGGLMAGGGGYIATH